MLGTADHPAGPTELRILLRKREREIDKSLFSCFLCQSIWFVLYIISYLLSSIHPFCSLSLRCCGFILTADSMGLRCHSCQGLTSSSQPMPSKLGISPALNQCINYVLAFSISILGYSRKGATVEFLDIFSPLSWQSFGL